MSAVLSDDYVQLRVIRAEAEKPESDVTTQRRLPASSGQGANDWYLWASAELSAFSDFQEDWDSEGAVRPLRLILDSARGFLKWLHDQAVVPPPFMVPTRTGGILLEWKTRDHRIDIEFNGPEIAQFACLNRITKELKRGELKQTQEQSLAELLLYFKELTAE